MVPLGVHIYAVGGNMQAARLTGIKVWLVLLFVYGMSGLLSGLGGVMSASRLYSANGNLGVGYELDAIAAVILGGTSFVGGIGTITGTLVHQRTGDGADTADEAGAAENDRGDGVQLVADAEVAVGAVQPRSAHHPAKAGEQAAHAIDKQQHQPDFDAGQPRRLHVAAHRVDMHPKGHHGDQLRYQLRVDRQ